MDSMTISNFDIYYQGIKDGNGIQECRNSNLKTDFVAYMKDYIEKEHVSEGTRKHKFCTLEAVKRFGKLKTFADLTSKNLVLLTHGCTMAHGRIFLSIPTTSISKR